jgi:MFS family permease
MDTTGAIIGPVITIILLNQFPHDYKLIFMIAFIPGIITMLLLFKLKDETVSDTKNIQTKFFEKFNYWSRSSADYKRISLLIYFFSFLSSSQMFVLLMLKAHGFSDVHILWAYVLFNIIYATGALPMGKLADRKGSNYVFSLGILFLMIGHFSLIFINSLTGLWIVMLIFGFSFACTEGTGKSWVSLFAPKAEMGAALGTMGAFVGLSALLGNIFTGIIWDTLGAHANFIISGIGLLILFLMKTVFTNRAVN